MNKQTLLRQFEHMDLLEVESLALTESNYLSYTREENELIRQVATEYMQPFWAELEEN